MCAAFVVQLLLLLMSVNAALCTDIVLCILQHVAHAGHDTTWFRLQHVFNNHADICSGMKKIARPAVIVFEHNQCYVFHVLLVRDPTYWHRDRNVTECSGNYYPQHYPDIGTAATVDWGNHTVSTVDDMSRKDPHIPDSEELYPRTEYTSTGVACMRIYSEMRNVWHFQCGYKSYVIHCQSLGNIGIEDLSSFCSNSTYPVTFGRIDTSAITDMSWMFGRTKAFNHPIGHWDTRNVQDMAAMFWDALSFNQPIGTWDTGHVRDMDCMFRGAKAFNQPLDQWNTQNVGLMRHMFYEAISFNQPLSHWDTGNVTDMSGMFGEATAFNSDISTWDTSNVLDMDSMFAGATSFNQPVDKWNTSKVLSKESMFTGATAFNQHPPHIVS